MLSAKFFKSCRFKWILDFPPTCGNMKKTFENPERNSGSNLDTMSLLKSFQSFSNVRRKFVEIEPVLV
jgi:hypothetical protein